MNKGWTSWSSTRKKAARSDKKPPRPPSAAIRSDSTSGASSHALSAHVVLDDRRLSEATAVLERITAAMHDDFGIAHVTVQFECESCAEDDRVVCTQVEPHAREPVSASGT